MAKYDIFISYSSKDLLPLQFCNKLESNGLSCWIAPRNISPGIPYAKAIMQGISESENVIVFISHNSILSEDVLNEIDYAHRLRKNIIPLFVEDIRLSQELAYYLNRKQWINLFESENLALSIIITIAKGTSDDKEAVINTSFNKNITVKSGLLDAPVYDIDYVFDKINTKQLKNSSGDFIMPVEDVFNILGRGIVFTGNIESGSIRVGDEVIVLGEYTRINTVVKRIERFRKSLDYVTAGDDCGILLRGIRSKNGLGRGMILTQNKAYRTTNSIEICAYILTTSEGSIPVNYIINDTLTLLNRTNIVQCKIENMSKSYATNGDFLTIKLKLDKSIFLKREDVVVFSFDETYVIAGVVSKIY